MSAVAVRDSASGLTPVPPDKRELTPREKSERLGTLDERRQADGYDVDAVLAASQEFRRTVSGSGSFKWMCRGEAIHIAQALRAVEVEVSRDTIRIPAGAYATIEVGS